MMLANEWFTARKNRKKVVRTVLQIVFILIIIGICITELYTFKTYKAYSLQSAKSGEDKGFIALSYFGVERMGTQNVISKKRLREHLEALKNLGYVTITQQDIIEYYQSGSPLPEKSLFIMFEDGRRDTAIFAQKLLEDLNFKATMLTYSENFKKSDPKFLKPSELIDLEKTSFWELGTNGHRLAFINVYDRYDNYLGELDPLEHVKIAPYLGRKYNHYLMDYIRDQYGVPKETYTRMKQRIAYEYEAAIDSYKNSIGYVPGLYVLMHSNTGSFGNHDQVSAENRYWLTNYFKMNFNREGFCLNQRNSSIYDLTRMQPQAYWSTNHLLMRIKYDINQDLDFVTGDLDKQKYWQIVKGAAEFQDETIILTSLPQASGLLRLKNSNDFTDLKLSVRMKGNMLGLQKIYLRVDDQFTRFLAVSINNNVLYVTEKNGGAEAALMTIDLDQHDGKERISIPQDKKAAEIRALETFVQYADSDEKAKIYAARLKDKHLEAAASVAEGAAEYKPNISAHAKGDRMLSLALKENRISIEIDGKVAVTNLPVSRLGAGSVYLESAWGGYGWSQRNLADDVYDGVFERLLITENTGATKEKVLFDSSLQGLAAVKFRVEQQWEALINWFIRYL